MYKQYNVHNVYLVYLHPDLEMWTLLIVNGDHTEKVGRFGHFYERKNLSLSLSLSLSLFLSQSLYICLPVFLVHSHSCSLLWPFVCCCGVLFFQYMEAVAVVVTTTTTMMIFIKISNLQERGMITGILWTNDHKFLQEYNLTAWQPCKALITSHLN